MAIPPLYEIIASFRSPVTEEFRDAAAHFKEPTISLVTGLKGCEIFPKPCGCQRFAITIDEIQLDEGFARF